MSRGDRNSFAGFSHSANLLGFGVVGVITVLESEVLFHVSYNSRSFIENQIKITVTYIRVFI